MVGFGEWEEVSLEGIVIDTQFHKCPCHSGLTLPGIHSTDDSVLSRPIVYDLSSPGLVHTH